VGFQRQTKPIVPAGIDLRVPSDVGEGSLILTNWKPTALGALRSRTGHEVLATFADNVTSNYLANGSTRYVGTEAGKLYRGATEIATGLSSPTSRLVTMNEYTWIIDPTLAKKDNGSVLSPWWPAAPSSAPTLATGGAGVVNGAVRYYVTFANADGHESNPSPISAEYTAATETVDVTVPAGTSDYPIRYIYRLGGGLENAFRVGELGAGGGTVLADNYPNDAAIRDNLVLEDNHDAPPAAKGAVIYGARIVVWDDDALYWTPINEPYYFPADNRLPMGDTGDKIVTVTRKGNSLRIYKQRTIACLYGDPDDLSGALEEGKVETIGIVGPLAVAGDGAIDYLFSRDGVYAFDGNSIRKVSAELDPIFDGESKIVGVNNGGLMPAINLAELSAVALGIRYRELWVSYPVAGATRNTYTAKLDLATGRWCGDSRGITAFNWEGSDRGFTGAINRDIVALDSADTDAGDGINVNWMSRYDNQGFPHNPKEYGELVLEDVFTNGKSLDCTAYFNRGVAGGADTLALGVVVSPSGQPTKLVLPFSTNGRVADDVAIGIAGDADGASEIIIGRMTLVYHLQPRRGKLLFTQIVDLSSPFAHEAVEIDLDIDSGAADITAVLQGAIHGDLADVATWSLDTDANPGRRKFPKVFAAPVFGKLWRLRCSSTQPFQIWSARLRVRALPVLADGVQGQSWRMPAASPGN
jgi:hypothetical protein